MVCLQVCPAWRHLPGFSVDPAFSGCWNSIRDTTKGKFKDGKTCPHYFFLQFRYTKKHLIQIIYQHFEGCAFGETNPIRFPESEVFSAQQSLDNSGYYNPYPSAAGYDYDAGYQVQALGEQDRYAFI